ncbi:MAG: hypothetical protein B6241_15170 [Spirochaetaceae bacterium 4572_59]|nr:MAG: hypothetical protein B6241_15170 [Spirochaetaceae bacterium 4572_59]
MDTKILIVEDSLFFGKLLKHNIESRLGYTVYWYKTLAETEEALEKISDISIALLDFHLPDAKDGEIIDLCTSRDLPSIVMTGRFSSSVQEATWSRKVIDYVLKEDGNCINYLIDMIQRFFKNKDLGILVVDDSVVARKHLKQLLDIHHFKVYQAKDGIEALEVLESHLDIKLVLTDYNMPRCDGFELTRKIRQNYPTDRLAIIGISAGGNHAMMIKFIKYGANDFFTKPFISDLLFCRIYQNLRLVDSFEHIKEEALIDHLTGLHNRRYLFETGDLLFKSANRTGQFLIVAMIDLDNFKKVNDSLGHDTGDMVLKKVSEIMKNRMRRSDLLCRYGGEEFCIVGNNMNPRDAIILFEALRNEISQLVYSKGKKQFNVTASIGLCLEKKSSLSEMITLSDKKMYEAKQQGKNRVNM